MKKIYFACSITGGRDHAHVYQDIVEVIKDTGMHVLSEAFADKSINSKQGYGIKHDMRPSEIWQWDMSWLTEAHAIIAEVSQPSLGVGYEIAKAHEQNKPVLALWRKQPDRKLSPMISGSPNVIAFEYDDVAETEPIIRQFIKDLG